MISVRRLLIGLAFAFTAYLAVRGLWWTGPFTEPLVLVASVGVYVVVTGVVLLWGNVDPGDDDLHPSDLDREPAAAAASALESQGLPTVPVASSGRAPVERMPLAGAVLALFATVAVPSALSLAVPPEARDQPYVIWYLGGIGALMVIVMVRRRPIFAWVGIGVLTAVAWYWIGILDALNSGLVGSILWVGMAQLLVMLTDRAAKDTGKLVELQRAASAWQAAHAVRQRERRVQIQRALSVAGPVLARTIAQGGALTPDERVEARLAEGSLRDELRGARLLDDAVRQELEAARRRGATVTVLDEGGLEGIDPEALRQIRARLVEALRSARSDRLYIRTSPHESVAVTVVGRTDAGRGLSDEDTVDLWQEITRFPAQPDADVSA